MGFEVAKLSTQNVGIQRQILEAIKGGCISPKCRHLFLLHTVMGNTCILKVIYPS